MREIDKGMLLAEYFSIDTSKGVASFIKWVKQNQRYIDFNNKLHSLRVSKSLRAKQIYEMAKDININKAHSMEEALVIYGKINYILKISDRKYYSNPFLIEESEQEKIILGDLKMNFDEKIVTINEFSLAKGYSFDVKKEYIRKNLEVWMNEVNEYIVKPINTFNAKDNFMLVKHAFTPIRIIQFAFVILWCVFCVFTKACNIESLNKVTTNGYGRLAGLLYYLLFAFSFIYLMELIVIVLYKRHQYKEYQRNYYKIAVDIDNKVIKQKNNLYEYMLKQITTNAPMDASINKFNELASLIEPIFYFSKRYAKGKRLQNNKVTLEEKISMVFYLLLVLAFALVFFIKMGGR